MIRKIIEDDYKEFIELNQHKYPDGLINSLKHKERVPLFFDNLSKAVTIAERRLGKKLKRATIKEVVYSMTDHLLNNLKRLADEQSLSDLEKQRIISEANTIEDLSREIMEEDHSKGLVDGRAIQA